MLRTLLSLLTGVVLAFTVPTVNAASDDPIRIGFIDVLSGPLASAAAPPLAQLQYEVERLNNAGGILGRKIEVTTFDNKLDPQQSVVQLQKALDGGADYIVHGVGSSVASALINAVDKHNQRNPDKRVLYFNYAALDPALTDERCSFWHFRFHAHEAMIVKVLTDWIAKGESETAKNIKKVFLINQDYVFGHIFAKESRQMLNAKRPDIEIVGDVLHPLGKVKDFTPYVTQMKTGGADAVITGNYGQDMVLLIKAAADYGLDIPFLTYVGNSPGTVTQIGEKGVDRIFLSSHYDGDLAGADMVARRAELYKKTGWDYGAPNLTTILGMLKSAAEKAGSTDPVKVALALEGLEYKSPTGDVVMRADDHQILMPMFISVMAGGMEDGLEGTNYNFHVLQSFSKEEVSMPSSCEMKRPK